ncbi:MAG: response regulator transcription factor, partial [Bacteroidia bacterium]
MKTRILLAESNFLVREGMKALLQQQTSFEVVATVENMDAMLRFVQKNEVDVLIIDHTTAEFGVACIRQAKAYSPSVQVLSISEPKTKREIAQAIDLGVTSYLLKDCGREEIIEAIEATAKGEKFFCGKIVDGILAAPDEVLPAELQSISCDGVKISSREIEIIQLVAEGMTNKEIADRLFLSTHTVTTHRKNIMSKLGVNNTAGLVLYAIRNQIIQP